RGKFEVEGGGATRFLDRLCAGRLPELGHAVRTPFLTARGRVASVLTVERLAADRFYLTGEARSEQRDFDWVQSHLQDGEARVANVTARDGILWLGGARSPEILATLGITRDPATSAVREGGLRPGARAPCRRRGVPRVPDLARDRFAARHL